MFKSIFKSIFNRKARKLNFRLHLAIQKDNLSEVEESLCHGADPNRYAMASLRHRPLACAIRYNASLPIINALLKAGADPQEPFNFMAREVLLSEAARLSGRADAIVQRLRDAEKEAEAKNGSRPLFDGSNVCLRRNFGT
jgi:hypothetical protein